MKVLRELGWNYVTLVYSDDFEGRSSMEDVVDMSDEYDVCIGHAHRLPMKETVSGDREKFLRKIWSSGMST